MMELEGKSLSYRRTLVRLRTLETRLDRLNAQAKPIIEEIERLRALLRSIDGR